MLGMVSDCPPALLVRLTNQQIYSWAYPNTFSN